jgi:hypothetical protein
MKAATSSITDAFHGGSHISVRAVLRYSDRMSKGSFHILLGSRDKESGIDATHRITVGNQSLGLQIWIRIRRMPLAYCRSNCLRT